MEACLIVDKSPKASATLARRCLQGMIRDFAGIKKGRLIDEIDALRSAVVDGKAPHGVIGAHMEKDVDVIIPVDAGEAEQLIGLIEMLFDEWYVARARRTARLAEIKAIADKIDAAKKSKPKEAAKEKKPEA